MPSDSSLGKFGGMLDDLKSRLGFEREDDRYESEDSEDYDDYDDYDEYSYDEYSGYDKDDSVGGFKPIVSTPSRYGRGDSTPNLVSIEDVKATTPFPSLNDDSAASTDDGAQQRGAGSQYVIDNTAPAPDSPAYRAAQRETQSRLESSVPTIEPMSSTSSGYYPTVGSRGLTVIKPIVYGDVEGVANAVRLGNAVVLAVGSTPVELSRRILDFSFGVASALGANVECPAAKVYVISRGGALTDDEKRRLRAQNIL